MFSIAPIAHGEVGRADPYAKVLMAFCNAPTNNLITLIVEVPCDHSVDEPVHIISNKNATIAVRLVAVPQEACLPGQTSTTHTQKFVLQNDRRLPVHVIEAVNSATEWPCSHN